MTQRSVFACLFTWVCAAVLPSGCGGGGQPLPAAPASCQAPPDLVVGWRPRSAGRLRPRSGSLVDAAGIAARAGMLYFATTSGICAVDLSGQGGTRALVSSGENYPVAAAGLWATDDGLLYFDGSSLRSIPSAGGPITLVASMSPTFVGRPAFDGQYLYGSELTGSFNSILHRVAVPNGTPESLYTVALVRDANQNVVESAMIEKLVPAAGHLDFTEEATVASDPKPLFRLDLDTRTVRSLHPLTSAGTLLAGDGDVAYVRAAPRPLPPSGDWSDVDVHLYRVDGAGALTAVLSPETPPMLATAVLPAGDQIYVGGRAHFQGDEVDKVVLAAPSIGTGGAIIGCLPGSGFVDSLATDGNAIYALVTGDEVSAMAVVRFSR